MRFQEPFRLRRNLAEIGEALKVPVDLPPRDPSGDLGSLYYSSNRYGDAIAEFARALERSAALAADDLAALREKLAWCHYWTGAYDEALRLLALLNGEECARPGALVLEGRIALERGDAARARAEAESALALATRAGRVDWIGPAWSLLGVIAQREGKTGEAREHFEEALVRYRIVGDLEGECRTHIHLGTLAKNECVWDEARRHLDRARRMAEESGFLYLYGSATLNAGNLGHRLGLLDEAETSAREARRVFIEIGYELGTVRAMLALARVALDRGRKDDLEKLVLEVETLCPSGRFPRESVVLSEIVAEDQAKRGHLDAAETRLRAALRLSRAMAPGGDAACEVSLRLAEVLLSRGASAEAERLAREALQAQGAEGDPSVEGRGRRILAEAALARNDREAGRGEIAEAIRVFERIGCRSDLARALAVSGRIEVGCGENGSEARALAGFLAAKRIREEIGDIRGAAHISVELARSWLRAGACSEARASLSSALRCFETTKDERGAAEARELLAAFEPETAPCGRPFDCIVTRDPATLETLRIAERVSRYPVTVLIEGETGTGKQLLARAIHDASPRAAGPFITVNCASLPEQILESELFGYVKGAFTGAVENRKGLFEEADGGTIFLDEIGKAGPHVQRSLLHVLDQGFIRPIGSTRLRKVDVRVICATSNLGLRRDIQEDRFLKDLFYRINDITLRLPPLRERRGDAAVLRAHFLARFRRDLGRPTVGFSPEVERHFERYAWPGNVREMEKAILRAVLLTPGDVIEMEHLPADLVFDERPEAPDGASGLKEQVEALEKRRVVEVLEKAAWNRSRAARELGLSLRGLRNKIQRYHLAAPRGTRAR
jgi:DNA-binding NtrC family response regulator